MNKRPINFLFYSCLMGVTLCALCRWWLCSTQQQYDRNRQLVNALSHGDTKRALGFVNAGADPDTPQSPPLPPSFHLLLDQFWQRKQLPASDRQTALMMACGLGWSSDIFPPGAAAYCSEDVSLVQTMLTHGADVQARNLEGETSLHLAVMCGRLRTAELLLQYGADVSVRDKTGVPR